MRNRVRRARFHTIPAEDASRIIDVVYLRVPLARRNAVRIRVFRCFDVNAIRRTRRRTQKATYALLQSILIAMQHVNPAVPRLKMHRLVRIIFRHRFPEHVPKGDAKSLRERRERLTYFTDDRWHSSSLTNAFHPGKLRPAASRLTTCILRCDSKPCTFAPPIPTTATPFGPFSSPPSAPPRPTLFQPTCRAMKLSLFG